MKGENVYQLLKFLKANDQSKYDDGTRILKFIYQSIYRDIIENGKKNVLNFAGYGTSEYNHRIENYNVMKKGLAPFLDGEDSILSYYIEMIIDGKQDYIDLFNEKMDVYLDMVENHYYNADEFSIVSIVFNMYSMLRAYHCHKDNFELFSKIVNDCDRLIDSSYFILSDHYSDYNSVFSSLSSKKKLLDGLISYDWYDKNDIVSKELKSLFDRFSYGYGYNAERVLPLLEKLNKIDLVYKDYLEVCDAGCSVDISVFNDIAGKLFYDTNRYSKIEILYDKKLLYGNRFEYFNLMLPKMMGNSKMAESLGISILNLDFSLFDYLNEKNSDNGDSFIKTLDILFDSDSFREVCSKKYAIFKACDLFNKGDIEAALDVMQELPSGKHKHVLGDGRVVGSVNNSINQVSGINKRNVGDRMIEAYRALYPKQNISYFVSRALNHNCESLEGFSTAFEEGLKASIEREQARLLEEQRQRELAEQARLLEEQRRSEDFVQKSQDSADLLYQTEGDQNNQSGMATSSLVGVSEEVTNDSLEKTKEETGFAKIKSIFTKRG